MSNLSDRITKARASRGGRGSDWYVTNGQKVIGPVDTSLVVPRARTYGKVQDTGAKAGANGAAAETKTSAVPAGV